MKRLTSLFSSAMACALLLLLIGCSTPPRREKFVPPPFSVDVHHPEHLSVAVTSAANAFAYSNAMQPGDEALKPSVEFTDMYRSALVDAIRACRLYVMAEDQVAPDILLDVTIRRMSGAAQSSGLGQSPYGAPSASALMVTEWCLTKRASGEVICRKDITTSNAHDAPDYIFGGMITAQRNAIEGMAATNIRQGIEWIARRTAP